ncbi:MAG: hypothetical protein ACR2OE_02040 [Thermomicrobiales bacterium]
MKLLVIVSEKSWTTAGRLPGLNLLAEAEYDPAHSHCRCPTQCAGNAGTPMFAPPPLLLERA